MYNKSILGAKVPRKLKVRPLIQLTKDVKIGIQVVHVGPAILLMRFLILVEKAEKSDQYFSYELAPYPISLFKDSHMRYINKTLLAQALTDKKLRTVLKEKSGSMTQRLILRTKVKF